MTLTVSAGLIAILAGAAASQRLEFRAGVNRLEERRARLAAEAGIARTLVELATQDKNAVNLQNPWATLGAAGSERFIVGDSSFRIEVVDAASRLNLNSVTQALLERIGLVPEQIDSLLDWREAGQTARPEGAKDEYYNGLAKPYNAKLRRFDSVTELLLVRGFTARAIFEMPESGAQPAVTINSPLSELLTVDSVSQDLNPNGQNKLNVNSGQATLQVIVQRSQISTQLAAAIVQRRINVGPFANIGQVLALPGVNLNNADNILDNLAVTGTSRVEGRLNLNTVTEDALNAIPDLTPDLVSAIVTRQTEGFTRLGDLTLVQGMSVPLLQRVAGLFSVNSQRFIVRVVGEVGGIRNEFEAVVSIEGDSPRTLKIYQPAQGAFARWGWIEDTETESVLVEQE